MGEYRKYNIFILKMVIVATIRFRIIRTLTIVRTNHNSLVLLVPLFYYSRIWF